MSRRPITLPRISIQSFDPDKEPGCLFGPDATARETKNGAAAEAGRREVYPMLDIAQSRIARHRERAPQVKDVRVDAADEAARAINFIERRILEGASLPAGKMASDTVLISPATAKYILNVHNDGNRPVRQSRVDEFAKIIRDGRWRLSSQGISFSKAGDLNNGQHRLNGIVQAGEPVCVYVTFGEDRDVFDILDTGAVRGGSDALSIAGFKNTAGLAAAARLLLLVEANKIYNPPKVRNDEILAIVSQHPGLQDATTPGHVIGSKLRCSVAALTVAFYRIRALTAHKNRVDEFIRLLREGTLTDSRDPILILRDGLLTKKLDAHVRLSGVKTFVQYAAVINAWNKHLHGRKGSLRWEHPALLPRPE